MTDEDVIQIICVDKPRCALCQFPFENDDSVVAVLDNDCASVPFPFEHGHTYVDESSRIAWHMCCGKSCGRSKRRVPCVHSGCRSLQLVPISSEYLGAANYDFNPPVRVELRRRNRIEWAVARRLKRAFLRQMPQEICHMVASYILCEMTAVALQERSRDTQPATFTIDLARDVYVKRIEIEGITYLQSLSNACPQDDRSWSCMYDTRQARSLPTIWIRYDHVGIRAIHFEAPNEEHSSSRGACGVWWTEVARTSGLSRVTIKSDGVKLRQLVDATDSASPSSAPVPSHGWPAPAPAPRRTYRLINMDTCEAVQGSSPTHLRMSSLDCNTPRIDGYSAAIFGFHIAKIYAHRSDDSTNFYGDMDMDSVSDSMLWMYMPVDENEQLSQIWAFREPGSELIGLVFRTSQERECLFGQYFVHPKIRTEFHLLYSTTTSPSRVYFSEWDPLEDKKRIMYMGFDNSDAAETDAAKENTSTCPPSLTATSTPPYTQSNELWYYTNCRLENVAKIACCIKEAAPYRPIIGMLVYYDNGHRACIGQYRPDWVFDTMTVDSSTVLHIGLARTRKNWPYVARIDAHNATAGAHESLSWMDVPWQGKLEWWFSQRQCRLFHYD